VPFSIVNQVFTYGQDTTTVIIDTGSLTLRAGPIDSAAFVVSARSTALLNGTRVNAFSGMREVVSAFVTGSDELVASGDGHVEVRETTGEGHYIVLNLRCGMVPGPWGFSFGLPGASTLLYLDGTNVPLNLSYHVKQVEPITAANGSAVSLDSHIAKSRAVYDGEIFAGEYNPLVRNFTAGNYTPAAPHDETDYLDYSTYVPTLTGGERVPVVIWLHGFGEGRITGAGGIQNQNVLKACKEGVAWITPDSLAARKAIVIVPQSPNRGWYVRAPAVDWRGYNDALTNAKAVIDLVIAEHEEIDRDRVYIAGDSLGGFGVWNMLKNYPGVFAAALVAPGGFNVEGEELISDDMPPLFNHSTIATVAQVPVWILNTGNDFPITNNTYQALRNVSANVRWTHYQNATAASADTWGQEHWVWMPTLDNRPATNDGDMIAPYLSDTPGQHVLDWLFAQRRK
jgi:predicted peptidase